MALGLWQQLANANTRAREFEIQFRQTERLLSSDLRERTERAAQLQDELATKAGRCEAEHVRPVSLMKGVYGGFNSSLKV